MSEVLKFRIAQLEDKVYLLENPYKYEVGFKFGDYIIIERTYKTGYSTGDYFFLGYSGDKKKRYKLFSSITNRAIIYDEDVIEPLIKQCKKNE